MAFEERHNATNGEWAQLYAALGWRVFPVEPRGKRPLTAHGFKDATTDLEQLIAWWGDDDTPGKFPDANIATPMGNGLVAIDVDDRKALRELRPLPKTVRSRTSGGRFHLIFSTNGHKFTNARGDLPDGIDVRGSGGYIVLPPSRHASGKRYRWENGRAPLDIPIAPIPDHLAERLRKTTPPTARSIDGDPIPAGARNETLTSLAGSMRRIGMTTEEINDALSSVNEHRCSPPLDYREVRQIAESVGRYATADVPLSAHSALIAQPPNADALHGLAGEIVRTIEPQTEADPWALLATILAAFGNAAGANAHMLIGATRHAARLNVVIVGDTAKARKGVSLDEIMRLFKAAASDWARTNIASGLSSGEGLIYQVRDSVQEWDQKTQEFVTIDPGVQDKRLFVVETELGRTLTVMSRDGSILSQLVRQAWDHGNLQNMSRTTNVRSTEAHITILGHVTVVELKNKLTDVEAWNGFANRFIWIGATRSRLLPRGGNVPERAMARLIKKLRAALRFAENVDEMDFDDAGGLAWDAVYEELADALPGLAGAMTARAEPQVLRLAMIYALLDGTAHIGAMHVRAALAVWGARKRRRAPSQAMPAATCSPIGCSRQYVTEPARRTSCATIWVATCRQRK